MVVSIATIGCTLPDALSPARDGRRLATWWPEDDIAPDSPNTVLLDVVNESR
jgi:hypothetical protein